MNQPAIRINDKDYAYPTSSKLGDAALIEDLTGLTHSAWRARYVASLEQAIADPDALEEDSAITVGIVAMAVARANPRWTRSRIVDFVRQLDWDQVEMIPGDEEEADELPPAVTTANGNGASSPSSSDSDTASNESAIPPSSGPPTLDTSPVERLVPRR